MKKQQVKNTLQFKKATIVNFIKLQEVVGGFQKPTGESCFEVCDTNVAKCSWADA